MWRKGNPHALLVGMYNDAPTMDAAWSFLKKLKTELLLDWAILHLGIYPKEWIDLENFAGSQRDMCTPMFVTALFIIAKRWKQPKCPMMDEWINKMW